MKLAVLLSLCRSRQRKQQPLTVHTKLDFKNCAIGYTEKDICYAAFKLTVLPFLKKNKRRSKLKK